MYEQQVLNYLSEIENTTYETRNSNQEILEELYQINTKIQTQVSGDNIIIENQKQTINLLGGELLILVALLLYLFIVRSLK